MARQDLIAALRNALERGETLQEAVQSFVNAGYNKREVEEAAVELQGKKPSKRPFAPLPVSVPTPLEEKKGREGSEEVEEGVKGKQLSKKGKKIFIMIAVIIVLIAIITLLVIIFRK